MTDVQFRVPFARKEGLLAQVPVDVLDAQLRLRGRAPLSGHAALSAGQYFAEAMLPDGRQLSASFEVGEDEAERLVDLTLKPSVRRMMAAPNYPMDEGMPAASGGRGEQDAGDQPLAYSDGAGSGEHRRPARPPQRGQGPVVGELRILVGNPLEGEQRPEREGRIELSPGARVEVSGGGAPKAIAFAGPDGRTTTIALPLAPTERCEVVLPRRPGGPALPHILFSDPAVELMLRYTGAGMRSEAARIAEAQGLLGEDAARAAGERPIGATLGAYVALRTSGLDRLRRWPIAGLAEALPWLPDGPVLLAEHLARQGRHAEALESLLRLRGRGLPFFASGLSYAVDRLAQYAAVAKPRGDEAAASGAGERLGWSGRAGALLADLRAIMARADFTRPILTYSEPRPAHPAAGRAAPPA